MFNGQCGSSVESYFHDNNNDNKIFVVFTAQYNCIIKVSRTVGLSLCLKDGNIKSIRDNFRLQFIFVKLVPHNFGILTMDVWCNTGWNLNCSRCVNTSGCPAVQRLIKNKQKLNYFRFAWKRIVGDEWNIKNFNDWKYAYSEQHCFYRRSDLQSSCYSVTELASGSHTDREKRIGAAKSTIQFFSKTEVLLNDTYKIIVRKHDVMCLTKWEYRTVRRGNGFNKNPLSRRNLILLEGVSWVIRVGVQSKKFNPLPSSRNEFR